MNDREFLENKKGVHLMGVQAGGEFTLCGDSFDISNTEEGYLDGDLLPTNKKIVTCPDCVRVILHIRGVKIK